MTECHALLHPVDSRLRGNDGSFAKVSTKGEGILCRLCCIVVARVTLPRLWIADQVRNDVTVLVCVGLLSPRPVDTALKPV